MSRKSNHFWVYHKHAHQVTSVVFFSFHADRQTNRHTHTYMDRRKNTCRPFKLVSKQVSALYSEPKSCRNVSTLRCRADENRCAFCDSSGARSVGGRLFQVVGPLTAKLRCLTADRTRGTSKVPLDAKHKSGRLDVAVVDMQRSLR